VKAARNVATHPGPDESTERVTSLVVGEELLSDERRSTLLDAGRLRA
jgi:hypothetical protein